MKELWARFKSGVHNRLHRVVMWLDTPPNEDDLFGVHIREAWQVFRQLKKSGKNEGLK